MAKQDAVSGSGAHSSRANVVLECCEQLVQAQMRALGTQPATVDQSFSCVHFNDIATRTFEQLSCGQAASRLAALHGRRPANGTNFSAAWREVETVVDSLCGGEQGGSADVHSVHVVFLSDGRPGELHKCPPVVGSEPWTVRVNREECPSAPAIVGRLAARLGAKLHLRAVSIGHETSTWPERLVQIALAGGAEATFMRAEDMNAQACTSTGGIGCGDGGDSSSSSNSGSSSAAACENARVLQRLASASHACLPLAAATAAPAMLAPVARMAMPPPPVARARMAMPPPPVARMMMPPPPGKRASSLAATFGTISSMFTSSCTGGARPGTKRQERTGDYEAVDDYCNGYGVTIAAGEQNFEACEMRADSDKHEWGEPFEVSLRNKPFACGGQRNAFHLFVKDAMPQWLQGYGLPPGQREHHVAKESRYHDEWKERLASHKDDLRTTRAAIKLSNEFNAFARLCRARLVRLGFSEQHLRDGLVRILSPSIYRLKSRAAGGQWRYMSVEPFLEGKYTKFNGNNGYVGGESQCAGLSCFDVAQAFTHWTYQNSVRTSSEAVMVCDIQGVGFNFTDPTICSESRLYGKTDTGAKGHEQFFRTHCCSRTCEQLGLVHHGGGLPGGAGAGAAAGERSTATSAIDILRTKHLRQRKRERDVDTREMQAAVKHGRKEPGNQLGTIKHQHNGVVMITDRDHRIGITVWPQRPREQPVAPRVPPTKFRFY
jgi:hypothetical protein